MELLAGEDNTEVVLQEGNCTFSFDYRRVYWNSRLRFEHSRLINTFNPSDVVADMFCGVGPFAIPAAKRGCSVYANDLNPNSYKALLQNCAHNHVEDRVFPSNLDAREFILSLGKQNIPVNQIIMNLPSTAEHFCDVFNHAFGEVEFSSVILLLTSSILVILSPVCTVICLVIIAIPFKIVSKYTYFHNRNYR